MPQDDAPPLRSKQLELFGKMHVAMDHVLEKLLLDAPPLPDSLKLQTQTTSLCATWRQVTEAFEKRKCMLQRRQDKEKHRNQAKRRQEALMTQSKSKDAHIKHQETKKSSKQASCGSPRAIKSSASPTMDKKTIFGTSPRLQKLDTDVKGCEKPISDKLRKLPVGGDDTKYKAAEKRIESDKGNKGAPSSELTNLLDNMQLQTASEKESKPKVNRKRSLESLNEALRVNEKRSKRKSLTVSRKQGHQEPSSFVEEEEVDNESEEKEEETEDDEGYSDSDEAEFIPELQKSPSSPVKPQKRDEMQPLKRQKQNVEITNEKKTTSQMTSREQLAAVVAKIRADEVAFENEAKYLSYEEKKQPVQLGDSSKFAIVLDDSDKEEKQEAEKKASVVRDEEESTEMQEQDSSTDEDSGVFDLNEEDVYVVEAILCVKEGRVLLSAGGSRRHKESDLYLVKWEGYNELTWEPDENIPRRLIEMFRERERAKRACQYQIKVAHERKEVTNLTTQAREIIYMIHWINQDLPMWELRSTLPVKTQVWLDKVMGFAPAKKRRDTKL